MKANVGGPDRAIRIIAGLALIVIGIFAVKSGAWMAILIVLGAILTVTGLVRFCGLYTLCGINTGADRNAGQK